MPVEFSKSVGLLGRKEATMKVNVQKSFYLAGEVAYLHVEIDNTACKKECSLIINHKMKVKEMNDKGYEKDYS